jgi:hypothetical protein
MSYGTLQNDRSQRSAIQALLAGAAPLPEGAIATGSVPRSVAEKLGETISVKDFGAVGDDSTDNLAAINAAQDYLVSIGGGTLLYPPGIYRVSSAILCRSNVRHIGSGKLATVLRNTGAHATARLNDCFNIGAMSINIVDEFTGYAGTLSADRRALTLTTEGAGANFAEGEGALLGATATVEIGDDDPPEQGFLVYIVDITGDVVTFESPLPEDVADPQLFKFSGNDSSSGYDWHLGHHIEVGNFTFAQGSIHNQCGYKVYIHDIDIQQCRNFITWNAFCHSIIERVTANYWNRACEIKLYSHESLVRDCTARWYDGTGGATPTTPLSFGEFANRITLDNFDLVTEQTSSAAGYCGIQYSRYVTIRNSRLHFLNMPAAAAIDVYDGLSALASSTDLLIDNCEVKVGGDAVRFFRTSDASPANPPADLVVRNCKFLGTVSSPTTAINLQGGDRIRIENVDLPADNLIAVTAGTTNVIQPSPSGLAKLPIDLQTGQQVNSRTALGTSASVGHLGISTTYGAAAVTRSIASATTSEQAYWRFRLPDDWASGGTLQLRARCSVQNGPAQVSATITPSVKKLGDNGVGSDLYSAGAVSVNSATATDYDLTFASTNLSPGDMAQVEVTFAIDNTGGGSTVTGRLLALKLLYQSTMKGR